MTQNGYISLHFLRRRENTGGISVSNICATFSRIEAFDGYQSGTRSRDVDAAWPQKSQHYVRLLLGIGTKGCWAQDR